MNTQSNNWVLMCCAVSCIAFIFVDMSIYSIAMPFIIYSTYDTKISLIVTGLLR
jgi:hypothetical protein